MAESIVAKATPALKMILQVGGVTGLIALLLAWELAAGVRRDSSTAVALLNQHLRESANEQTELSMIRNLLLQNCINNAGANSLRRDACFDAMVRPPQR